MKDFIVEDSFKIGKYFCAILAMWPGYRCGYVSFDEQHPMYGKHYSDIDVDVHGGLTFGEVSNTYPIETINKYQWVGFDCVHSGDAYDPDLVKHFDSGNASSSHLLDGHDGVARDIDYVKNELEQLVRQLQEMEKKER